jgi:AbiV family abortive infection protein
MAASPRIAFHLATLALEETGKASLLAISATSAALGREEPSIVITALDDHVRKLFWALWGPSIQSERVTVEQIESLRGMARHIHETRLRGLYVDVSADGVIAPETAVAPADAELLVGMAAARLDLEPDHQLPTDPNRRDLQLWFIRATEDPERRNLIMGKRSLDRLAELRSPSAWIQWLKQQFDEADARSKELYERELRRVLPGRGADQKRKWQVKVRLHTTSHSIRPKPLSAFNEGLEWFQLTQASKSEAVLTYDLLDGVPIDRLWDVAMTVADFVVVSLSIGSFGFFFYYPPRFIDTFYERIVDVESGAEVRPRKLPPAFIDFGRRPVLDERLLNNALLSLAITMSFESRETAIIRHYMNALAIAAKSDVFIGTGGQVLGEFYRAFRAAVELFPDNPDHGRAPKGQVLASIKGMVSGWDEAAAVVEAAHEYDETGVASATVSMEDAFKFKVTLDGHLISLFRRLEPNRLGGGNSAPALE